MDPHRPGLYFSWIAFDNCFFLHCLFYLGFWSLIGLTLLVWMTQISINFFLFLIYWRFIKYPIILFSITLVCAITFSCLLVALQIWVVSFCWDRNILSHYGQTRQSYEPRSLSPARLCLLIPGSVSESY